MSRPTASATADITSRRVAALAHAAKLLAEGADILDNRIVTKPYGRAFMQALPKCPVEIVT